MVGIIQVYHYLQPVAPTPTIPPVTTAAPTTTTIKSGGKVTIPPTLTTAAPATNLNVTLIYTLPHNSNGSPYYVGEYISLEIVSSTDIRVVYTSLPSSTSILRNLNLLNLHLNQSNTWMSSNTNLMQGLTKFSLGSLGYNTGFLLVADT